MIDEIDDLFEEIDRGREGKNQGYSTGLPKLDGVIDGVCPKTYTLVFAGTGNGNTIAVCMRNHIKNYRVISGKLLKWKIPR